MRPGCANEQTTQFAPRKLAAWNLKRRSSADQKVRSMADPNRNLIGEWRVADRVARELEQAIARASLDALEGRGPAPTPEDHESVRQHRAVADDLFQIAMAATKERVDELRGR